MNYLTNRNIVLQSFSKLINEEIINFVSKGIEEIPLIPFSGMLALWYQQQTCHFLHLMFIWGFRISL